MSARSADSRDGSPEGDAEKRSSKKRKVLSCFACRERKMKCDRVYPVCGRCVKTGRAGQCTYDPRLLEELQVVDGTGHAEGGHVRPVTFADRAPPASSTSGPTSSEALNWKLRVQEWRLGSLERKLGHINSTKHNHTAVPSHLEDFDMRAHEPRLEEAMLFRGQGFKTRFYGSTSPFSLIAQFGELQTFTKRAILTEGIFSRIRADLRTFREKKKATDKQQKSKGQMTDADIFNMLPAPQVVDAAVMQYFQRVESTYRILHEPSFWTEYRVFWDQADRPANFAVILVLIVAITKGLFPDQEAVFVGDGTVGREAAGESITVCDIWLQGMSRKHLALEFFQIQCLSLIAKRINCIKMKQDWVNSGEVLRYAIAAGFHRSSELLAPGKTSEYEKEMRRRLWSTIAELELQSSIDSGQQSGLSGLYFDTRPPTNISDVTFSRDKQQSSVGQPLEHHTSSSYLVWSMRSLPLRIHLTQLLNNPSTDLLYSDIMHYDSQLCSLLAELPKWTEDRTATASALLDLQIRQFLLLLHRPYAKLASTNPRYKFSLTACISAANTILSIHDNLINKGSFELNHSRNDALRTVITLAEVVYHNSLPSKLSEPIPRTDPQLYSAENPAHSMLKHLSGHGPPVVQIPELPRNDFMTTTLCTSAIELMERSRGIFEHKIMRLGTGFMENWLISAALGLMPSLSTGPDDIASRVRKAIDRVTSTFFRLLALQKDPSGEFATALRNTITTASPAQTQHTVSTPSLPTPLNVTREASWQPYLAGATGLATTLGDGAKNGTQGTWDPFADMQVDMAGWNFPDVWAYDLGGDF